MAVKLEYALKDAKGKTIVIPKEKIVEELYHQRISFSFEKTKSKIQNYEKSTKEDTDEFLQKEIQSMTEQVADDFYNACLHTYMNKYYSTILKIQDYQHEQEQKEYRIPSEPPKDLETKLKKEQQEIKAEIYQKLMDAVKAVNTSVQSESILKQYLERELKKQQNYIEDEIHRFEISGALDALDAENIQYYQVVCESYYEACDACKKLHRKKQPVSEAKEGINLPPLHPNCRCTIGSYIDNNDTDSIINQIIKKIGDLILAITPLTFDTGLRFGKAYVHSLLNTNLKISSIMELVFYLKFYPELKFTSYTHSNAEFFSDSNVYYYDPETLQSIVMDGGKVISPIKLSIIDQQILKLMEKRDRSTSEQEIVRLSRQLSQLAAGSSSSIDISKPVAYYEIGRDTTDEILQLMKETERKYEKQRQRGWIFNLLFFKSVVQNNGELDLKNLSAYQTNATYVFDGEIVDRDALGNITYGYFGRYLGIPTPVLLFSAGYAQYQAGTSRSDYFWTSGDDPRDQYRILQGILLYDKIHEKN